MDYFILGEGAIIQQTDFWFDVAKSSPCTPLKVGTGDLRCVGVNSVAAEDFSDSACTIPIGFYGQDKKVAVTVGDTLHIYELDPTAPYVGPRFQPSGNKCELTGTVSGVFSTREIDYAPFPLFDPLP